jgi:hypothetical protein
MVGGLASSHPVAITPHTPPPPHRHFPAYRGFLRKRRTGGRLPQSKGLRWRFPCCEEGRNRAGTGHPRKAMHPPRISAKARIAPKRSPQAPDTHTRPKEILVITGDLSILVSVVLCRIPPAGTLRTKPVRCKRRASHHARKFPNHFYFRHLLASRVHEHAASAGISGFGHAERVARTDCPRRPEPTR